MTDICETRRIEAVIFDLDGVLLDSEQVWDQVRRNLTIELGGKWRDEATDAMMGMSASEWSGYMHNELAVPLDADGICRRVVEGMRGFYRTGLPLIPGAKEAVGRMAARWPLGLASSSNRELIDLVLEVAQLTDRFQVTVSSEEVSRGKPSPDVYLETARGMGIAPEHCVAVEDSGNGIRAGKAAGMFVIAVPNRALPPESGALALADKVLDSIAGLNPAIVEEMSDSC